MQKASYEAFIENQNVNLAGIRAAEINYFSTFFGNFAAQSVLMASVAMGCLNNIPAKNSFTTSYAGASVLYWLTMLVAFSGSMHILLNAVFLSVFGQGLALRGPLGSMKQAVEGMASGQSAILITFVVASIFFGFNVTFMYWHIMEYPAAVLCNLIVFAGMAICYRSILRIYNKFKVPEGSDNMTWDEDAMTDNKTRRSSGISRRSYTNVNPMKTVRNSDFFIVKESLVDKHNEERLSQRKERNSWKKRTFAERWALSRHMKDPNDLENATAIHKVANKSVDIPSLSHSGLITMNVNEIWKKVFVVIKDSNVSFYNDKISHDKYPSKMIRGGKAVDLEDYIVRVNSEEPPYYFVVSSNNDSSSASAPSKGATNKSLEFLCDSLKEAKIWIGSFKKAINIARMVEERNVYNNATWALGDARRSRDSNNFYTSDYNSIFS